MNDPVTINFATAMFQYHDAECSFAEQICDAGFGDYNRIGGDHYDNSIEFYQVDDSARMNEAAQRVVYDAGFSKAFVNHKDGWETHYSWSQRDEFKPSRGWRRRYVNDPNATTTNVIAGEPKPGYYEISYWPDGWSHKEWLDSGYMRIVPDPLEAGPLPSQNQTERS